MMVIDSRLPKAILISSSIFAAAFCENQNTDIPVEAQMIASLDCNLSPCRLSLVRPNSGEKPVVLDYRQEDDTDPLAAFSLGWKHFVQNGCTYDVRNEEDDEPVRAYRESRASTLICNENGRLAFMMKGTTDRRGTMLRNETACMRITRTR